VPDLTLAFCPIWPRTDRLASRPLKHCLHETEIYTTDLILAQRLRRCRVRSRALRAASRRMAPSPCVAAILRDASASPLLLRMRASRRIGFAAAPQDEGFETHRLRRCSTRQRRSRCARMRTASVARMSKATSGAALPHIAALMRATIARRLEASPRGWFPCPAGPDRDSRRRGASWSGSRRRRTCAPGSGSGWSAPPGPLKSGR
jgi:hypothetical protein